MILNPWHAFSYGADAPEHVDTVIEIVKGSKAKYELDKEAGILRLDRILKTDLTYPFDYGFIPQTYCDDEDPLDVLVICSEPLLPLSLVEVTPIGALHMVDGGQQDDKIIAVVRHDHKVNGITSLEGLPKEQLEAIRFFFENYKKPEGKVVNIDRFVGKQEAQHIIQNAIKLYKEKFKPDTTKIY